MTLSNENQLQSIQESTRLMTLKEVAAYLRVSSATITRWIKAGRLRSYRPGGPNSRRLFSVQQIQALLAQHESGQSP
jgi:excisionase family DNA binding protein